MLDYLEQLIKEQQWEEALILAERLLLDQDNRVEDLFRINMALVTARVSLGEYAGAILLGEHSLGMASDLQDWGAYLTLCHYIGVSYSCLNQWPAAREAWLNYINHLELYGQDHLFEVITWFHLGVAHEAQGDLEDAVRYHLKAREVAERCGTSRQVLGVNHAIIHDYVKLGKFDLIPELLAKTAHYLRNHPEADEWGKAKIFNLQVRANFALQTRRYERARLVALRGLSLAVNEPLHQFAFHMILASVAQATGHTAQMINHYLAARVAAIRARRYDCEYGAAESLYKFMQAQPNALEASLSEMVMQDIPLAWFEMEGLPRR
jgi:tetratricopeptide (TPR) repeat protein